ncbi:MAG: DUF3098 domain-containing protein [bacterium]
MTAKKTKKVQIDRSTKDAQVARQPVKHTSKISKKKAVSWVFPLERKNFIWAGSGLVVIIIGYILMATGITDDPALVEGTWNNPLAISVAPVLLVIGYCILIPFAILKLFRKEDSNQE